MRLRDRPLWAVNLPSRVSQKFHCFFHALGSVPVLKIQQETGGPCSHEPHKLVRET